MPPVTPNLYFSEYIDLPTSGTASSDADAIEIYNATDGAVNLAGCEVRVHSGAVAGSTDFTLSGSLASHDVLVLCTDPISAACDLVIPAFPNLSGDDAVALVCPVGGTMTLLDVIGEYGTGADPGTEWGGTMGNPGTQNNTLRRLCSTTIGDRNATNDFTTSQWTSPGASNVSGLGVRTCPCSMVDLTCP
jgi:hypothetical protein